MIIEKIVIKIQFFLYGLSQILPVDVNPVSKSGVIRGIDRPIPPALKVIHSRASYATLHGLGFDLRYVWLINWCPEQRPLMGEKR
jgi:hypothetical protein